MVPRVYKVQFQNSNASNKLSNSRYDKLSYLKLESNTNSRCVCDESNKQQAIFDIIQLNPRPTLVANK